jgi:hypothetical protein
VNISCKLSKTSVLVPGLKNIASNPSVKAVMSGRTLEAEKETVIFYLN